MKNILFLLFGIFLLNKAFSQKPIIQNIHPINGKQGDIITVNGNFFSDSAHTIVSFGEVKGKLLTITPIAIQVEVPLGMNSPSPIAVIDLGNNLTASSLISQTPFFYYENELAKGVLTLESFSIVEYPVGFKFPYCIAAGDMNEDGLVDILTLRIMGTSDSSLSILYRKKDNTGFETPYKHTGGIGVQLDVADLNSDGKLDVMIGGDAGNHNFNILINKGNKTFDITTFNTANMGPETIMSGDFNNDGRMDLLVGNHNSGFVSVYYRNSNDTYASSYNIDVQANQAAVTMGDFNGDHLMDFATANRYTNNIGILFRKSDNLTFEPPVYINSDHPQSITATDVNSDSLMDIAFSNCCYLSVLTQIKGSSVFSKDSVTFDNAYTFLIPSDLNSDRKIDFLSSRALYQGKGMGDEFEESVDLNPDDAFNNLKFIAADFNHDGYLDIATQNNSYGTVSVYYRRPKPSIKNLNSFIIPNLVTPNGDGKNDVLVLNNLQADQKIEIYNSWGTKIFSSTNYSNEWGKDALAGVYFYSIQNEGKQYKGWIQILY